MTGTEGAAMGGGPGGPGGHGRSSLAAVLRDVTGAAARRPDPVDVLMLLCERAVTLLRVDDVGVLARDGGGALRVVAWSGADPMLADDPDEGAASTSLVDPVADLAADADAVVAPRTAQSYPLTADDAVVGFLRVIAPAPLAADDEELAQVLADLAALALLRLGVGEDALVLAHRVQRAVHARATLGQAIGMLAERLGLEPDGALRRLRDVADGAGLGLVALVTRVVGRDVLLPDGLRSARSDVVAEDGAEDD